MHRFRKDNPCPICGGSQEAPRGQGQRCFGYLSDDEQWAHCTRPEHAGSLEISSNSQAYAHRLAGDCRCGKRHDRRPPEGKPNNGTPHRHQIEATHDYRDESGRLLFQVVRYTPKDFRQRRPDGNGDYIYNLDGVQPILYRLPELLAADPNEPVYVPEGEKHVDRLIELGLLATTFPMGALKSHLVQNVSALKGRPVVVLPDNDPPNPQKPAEHLKGQRHAQQVAERLHPLAKTVKVVELPGLPEKGDILDWLERGHSVAELRQLVEDSPLWEPPATNGHCDDEEVRLEIRSMLTVVPRTVQWLWPKRIPKGKLTILGGDPGLGKSFLTLDITARISVGGVWPDEGQVEQGNVLLFTVEDDLEDTVYPRLNQLEADMGHIYAINPVVQEGEKQAILSVEKHLTQLEIAILERKAVLLVLDPLLAFTGRKADTYKMSDVRAVLSPLAAMADRTRCSILGIIHLNKRSSEMNSLYRLTASLDFVAAARSVLAVGKHPDYPDKCVLAGVKANLSQMPKSLMFHIDNNGYFRWGQQVDLDANALLGAAPVDPHARNEAKEFLKDILVGKGDVPAKEVLEGAETLGIKKSTLNRAKKELGVAVAQVGEPGKRGGGGWVWRMPSDNQKSE
jgi:putative DNA primase/helicase